MPTNRRRRTRNQKGVLTPAELAYLSDADTTLDGLENYELLCFRDGMPGLDGGHEPHELWEKYRDDFLPTFIAKNPGKRPLPWWQWDAPRQPDQGSGFWYEGTLCKPRQRLGGIGTPSYEVLAYVPYFAKGIPTSWVTQFEEDYYTGRVKDIPGDNFFIVERNDEVGDFKGKAIDPNFPPTFESEAAYLQRHGLLTVGEERYIEKHPELLEPEILNLQRDKID